MIELTLLGSPVVARDGMSLSFDTRKSIALLAMLAIEPREHTRERLAGLLWPDASAERARSALRRTLSVTSTAVGAAVTADRATVRLVPGTYRCDVDEFLAAAAAGDPTSLTRAAVLYRDDFMAGFVIKGAPEFDDWQLFTADGLRAELATVLTALVAEHIGSGDLDAALRHARRWLTLDTLHEPAHQALIRLHAWTGQRTAALQQYRSCVRLLDRQLGVAPLLETRQLAEAVRTGRLGPPPRPAAKRHRDPRPRPPRTPGEALFGRHAERAVIAAMLARVAESGGALEITGPPGIGKTRMLAEVSEVVRAQAGAVLDVRCHERERALTYGVAVALLRASVRERPDLAAILSMSTRSELARLLPELGADAPAAAPLDGPGAVVRLYAAVSDALVAATARGTGRPAAIIVDDVHFADPASAELLAYLLRRLPAVRALVALAHAAEFPADSPLPSALSDAADAGLRELLVLGPLDRDAVHEALQANGLTDAAAQGAELHRQTGGLPLLVVGYARALREALDTGTAPPAIPADVRNVLVARVAAMSEVGQQVLAGAAILGGEAEFDVLRATSGRSDVEVVDAIEEAMRAGLLLESRAPSGGAAGYHLPYAALEVVVEERISAGRRRLLHGRAADALMRRSARHLVAGQLATHLQDAGRTDEAAQWYWRASLDAEELFDHQQALEHVEEALSLGYSPAEAHVTAGGLLTVLGRYRDALAAYEAAAAVVDELDAGAGTGREAESSVRALAAIEHRLADVHHRLGDYAVAAAHAQTALDLLDGRVDADPVLIARLYADQALIAYRQGDDERAGTIALLARSAAEATADDAALAQILDVQGMLAARSGSLADAEVFLRESLKVARAVADPSYAVAALNNLARVLADREDLAGALVVAEEALALGLAHGDRHRAAALHTNLADLMHAGGREAEAIAHLKAAAVLFAGIDEEPLLRPEIWKLVQW